MKLVIRTVVFHLMCIIFFSFMYLNLSEQFYITEENKRGKRGYLDFLMLSTTIQSGVGISDLYPLSYYSKIIVIIQQIIMLFTHVITLYIFTL